MNIEIIDITVPTADELIFAFNDYDFKCAAVYHSLRHCWGWTKSSDGTIREDGAIVFGEHHSFSPKRLSDGIVLPVIHAKIDDDLIYQRGIINFFGVDWYVSPFSESDVQKTVCLFPYTDEIDRYVYPTDNIHAEARVKEWFDEIKKEYEEK